MYRNQEAIKSKINHGAGCCIRLTTPSHHIWYSSTWNGCGMHCGYHSQKRRKGHGRSPLPPLISDTLVTGMELDSVKLVRFNIFSINWTVRFLFWAELKYKITNIAKHDGVQDHQYHRPPLRLLAMQTGGVKNDPHRDFQPIPSIQLWLWPEQESIYIWESQKCKGCYDEAKLVQEDFSFQKILLQDIGQSKVQPGTARYSQV